MSAPSASPAQGKAQSVIGRTTRFLGENGAYLTIRHAGARCFGAARSRLVASSLGRPRRFWIGADSTILGAKYISIGEGFAAGSHLWLEAIRFHRGTEYQARIRIGNNVTLGDLVRISANASVDVGNDVLMGSKIYISDHNHGTYGVGAADVHLSPHLRRLSVGEPVRIGDNAWIGESVTILPGVTVGEGSVIGANSVVTSTIPPFSIAAGNPARVIKRIDPSGGGWRRVEADGPTGG